MVSVLVSASKFLPWVLALTSLHVDGWSEVVIVFHHRNRKLTRIHSFIWMFSSQVLALPLMVVEFLRSGDPDIGCISLRGRAPWVQLSPTFAQSLHLCLLVHTDVTKQPHVSAATAKSALAIMTLCNDGL